MLSQLIISIDCKIGRYTLFWLQVHPMASPQCIFFALPEKKMRRNDQLDQDSVSLANVIVKD